MFGHNRYRRAQVLSRAAAGGAGPLPRWWCRGRAPAGQARRPGTEEAPIEPAPMQNRRMNVKPVPTQ
jgi:hypothetical protein